MTTRRARARKAEQRSQRAVAQLNLVCSAFTQEVNRAVSKNVNVHQALPAEVSGQLPLLGLCAGEICRTYWILWIWR